MDANHEKGMGAPDAPATIESQERTMGQDQVGTSPVEKGNYSDAYNDRYNHSCNDNGNDTNSLIDIIHGKPLNSTEFIGKYSGDNSLHRNIFILDVSYRKPMSKPDVLALVLKAVKEMPNCQPKQIVTFVVGHGFSEESIRQTIFRARKNGYLDKTDIGRYYLTDLGKQRAKELIVVDQEEMKKIVAGRPDNAPSARSDSPYALLKTIAQLRRDKGKRAFDEAYEAVKALDP